MTPRPTFTEIIEPSVRKLCENRSFVVQFNDHATPDEVFDVIMDLPCMNPAFIGNSFPCGFEIAKALEDKYVIFMEDITGDFIDCLDNLHCIGASIMSKLNEEWTKRQLEPSLFPDDKFIEPKIGSTVSFSFDDTMIAGIVKKNKPTGHSVVFVKELGHVEGNQTGTTGVIIPWEQLIHES